MTFFSVDLEVWERRLNRLLHTEPKDAQARKTTRRDTSMTLMQAQLDRDRNEISELDIRVTRAEQELRIRGWLPNEEPPAS